MAYEPQRTGPIAPGGDGEERTVTTRQPLETAPVRRYDETRPVAGTADLPRTLNIAQDRVRWSAIIAGLLTALTALLVLNLLGLAIGLTTVNAAQATAQGGAPADLGRNAGIWAAISGILAFLLGGYVAGRTAAVFDRGWGALNGAMVFLIGVPITLWLASQGIGAVLGSVGGLASSLAANPQVAQQAQQGATQAAGQAQQAAQQAQQAAQQNPTAVGDAAARVRDAAWLSLVGVLLGLAASAVGGALGTRREVRFERASGQAVER
ncbi:MAG: hypothetical protein JO057_18200 [Chloroflexi bacterium]|nr:hypothetical protein [Chloroflexota bacterium]